jgi:hypothetical protein
MAKYCGVATNSGDIDKTLLGEISARIAAAESAATAAVGQARGIINSIRNIGKAIDVTSSLALTASEPYIGELALGAPEPPSLSPLGMPPLGVDYREDAYSSDLLDAVRDWLLGNFRNGADALSEDAEDAMFQISAEQDLLAIEDEKDRLAGEWAESGALMADGNVIAAVAAVENKYIEKKLVDTRKISEDSEDQLIKNTRFTVQKARELEDILRELFSARLDRILEAAAELIRWGERAYGIYTDWYRSIAALHKAKANIYEDEIQALSAFERAKVKIYRAKLDYAIATLKAELINTKVDIERAKVDLLTSAEADKDIAILNAHLTAGLLSSHHASSQMSFAESESDNESDSASNSVSCEDREVHSYEGS